MNPALYLEDLREKPDRLRALSVEGVWSFLPRCERLVLVGMGSSHYANQVAAARLRARGVAAVAELASSDLLPVVDAGTVVIAVSASGSSEETLDAVRRLREQEGPAGAAYVALTNKPGSSLEELTHHSVAMDAGEERGGVACRSFQHSLVMLLALEARLTGRSFDPGLLERVAAASEHLLAHEHEWLPEVSRLLLGPSGTHVVAPARRLSSAFQSALMLREGPRLPAVGCETGDWSHVDVYLTKTTDYRMLLLGGSRWEPQLLDWTEQRGTTVVAVGTSVPSASYTLRYPHDEDDDVRLLTETLVAELVAARAWLATG